MAQQVWGTGWLGRGWRSIRARLRRIALSCLVALVREHFTGSEGSAKIGGCQNGGIILTWNTCVEL